MNKPPPLIVDLLGDGATAVVEPHDDGDSFDVVYRIDDRDVAAVCSIHPIADVYEVTGLNSTELLRQIRCLMFALDRLMQIEFAQRQRPSCSPTNGATDATV